MHGETLATQIIWQERDGLCSQPPGLTRHKDWYRREIDFCYTAQPSDLTRHHDWYRLSLII